MNENEDIFFLNQCNTREYSILQYEEFSSQIYMSWHRWPTNNTMFKILFVNVGGQNSLLHIQSIKYANPHFFNHHLW